MENRTVTLNGTEFTLGKKYKDKFLGNEGLATAGISYLTGCDQLQLTWNDSTKRPVAEWIDVTRIEDVEVEKRAGGASPTIPSRAPV